MTLSKLRELAMDREAWSELICTVLSHSVVSNSFQPCGPGHLPNPGIQPRFPALQVDSLPSEPPAKPCILPVKFFHLKSYEIVLFFFKCSKALLSALCALHITDCHFWIS